MSLTFYAILIVAHIFNREPLEKTKFTELPIGAIQPQGWLLEQLNRQASGLTGHLDEVYPEVMGDSNAWLEHVHRQDARRNLRAEDVRLGLLGTRAKHCCRRPYGHFR